MAGCRWTGAPARRSRAGPRTAAARGTRPDRRAAVRRRAPGRPPRPMCGWLPMQRPWALARRAGRRRPGRRAAGWTPWPNAGGPSRPAGRTDPGRRPAGSWSWPDPTRRAAAGETGAPAAHGRSRSGVLRRGVDPVAAAPRWARSSPSSSRRGSGQPTITPTAHDDGRNTWKRGPVAAQRRTPQGDTRMSTTSGLKKRSNRKPIMPTRHRYFYLHRLDIGKGHAKISTKKEIDSFFSHTDHRAHQELNHYRLKAGRFVRID